MFAFRSLRWAALGCLPLLLAVESSPAAQGPQWSAPKAARAAAQAQRLAAGESETPPEIKPAPESERAEPLVNSAENAPARPAALIARPGESIPPELQALLNQAPAKLSAQPNGPAPQAIPFQPQSRLQSTTTAASTPASASVPAAAPLSPQSDPAQAGERRPAHSDPLLPSSANIQPGQGGIFKWPSGMRLEYAEAPQPPPQSPMANRTKALFRQSLEVPPPVQQTSAAPAKSKALFSRTPAPQPETVPAQALATAPPAKPKALLPGGQIYPNFGANNPQGATPMIHNAPSRSAYSSMPAEQSRALFAPRPDGRGMDEAMLEWFQATNTSRALFSQSADGRPIRLPAPTTPTVSAANQASRQAPAVQTAAAASPSGVPAQPMEPSDSQPPKSKALFSKPLWPKPTEPDPLLKYVPREHEPRQAAAAAVPAAGVSGNEKGSKALFPRSMFIRSQQQPPSSAAVATSAPAKTGPTLARAPASEDPLKAPQLLAEPARQAVNLAQKKASSASGTPGKRPGGTLDSTGTEQPADPRDWRPSKRRPKAARNSVASATSKADSSASDTGVSLVGNVEKQSGQSSEVQASDAQPETNSADAASACEKETKAASESSCEPSSSRKRNPLR